MRTFIILATTLLTFSCSNKEHSKSSNNDSLQTTVTATDTLQTESDILNENIHYIGFIDELFSNDNEVYIELYFTKDETSVDEYNKIVKLADSLIYKDDENSRYKFPHNLTTKYFDLRGLSKLKIFDENNKFFCHADFLRVEYLNQNISSPFIAVYRAGKKIKADSSYYCISNFNGTPEQKNYSGLKDAVLTESILKKLKEQKPYYGFENNGTHLHISDNDTILSVVNSANYAYVVLTTNNDFKVLYKSPEPENVMDLRFIPMTKNKLPYILTRNGAPETDIMWDSLLYFNGTEYTATNRQRKE